MAGKTKIALLAALGVSAALLAACDNGPSAVASKPEVEADTPASAPAKSEARTASREDHRSDPVPDLDGKPIWSASRRYSAEQNVQRAFDRNGEAFGARTAEDFARKAHAFVGHPPAGVETLRRANGDTLFYDPRGNVFAVADKAGTPRTMFKPDEGAAYWEEQKTRENRRRTARADREDEA